MSITSTSALQGTGQGAYMGAMAGGGWGALAGGALGLATGILSGKDAKKQAKQANEMAIWQQIQNQKWQEYMSNTAHQREMQDLKAAGLNPTIAANGGASTPGGGVGNSPAYESTDYTGAAKGVSEGFQKALALKSMENETKGTEANVTKALADAEKAEADKTLAETQNNMAELQKQILEAQKPAISAKAQAEEIEAQVRTAEGKVQLGRLNDPFWMGMRGFADMTGLLLSPAGQMINMATSASKASAMNKIADKEEKHLIKQRHYDKNGKYHLIENEYE